MLEGPGATVSADAADPIEAVVGSLSRRMVAVTGGLAALAALLYVVLPLPVAAWRVQLAGGSCVAVALICWGLARFWARVGRRRAVLTVSLAVLAVVALNAVNLDMGVHAAGLDMLPLLICVVAVLVGVRSALGLAAASAVLVLGMAGAEMGGWLGVAAGAAGSAPVELRTALQLLVLLAGVVIGVTLSRALERSVNRSVSRELRFIGLLSAAADWYWEMDAEFRFTFVSEQADGHSGLDSQARLGRTPWEIENFGFDALAMDAHRADLESHQPFTNALLRRRGADGLMHWFAVSGRPRFNARGVFDGYWGVGRDITAEHEADLARVATEARYRELFARSPAPLVLHRNARVLDANAAAQTLFGIHDAATLIGRNLLEFYDRADGSRELAAERALALREMAVGEAMPLREFVLRSANGRRIVAQVTSVKVDTGAGQAILSIYRDDTERLRSEAARARSEALMTHLLATSPDSITLSDMATGRYVMANDAFLRLSGWRQSDVIGKTSLELGLWPSPQARQRFVDSVREGGEVRDVATGLIDRTGTPFSLRVSGAQFTLEGREYLVTIGRDVTAIERERLERDAILENASIGIATTRDRVFQLANPKFEQMFGWAPGTLVGQPGSVTALDSDDYEALGRLYGPALARGEAVDLERTMRRADGSTFLCRLLARAVDPNQPGMGSTVWIAEDVTERRAVDQALARARDDAEAANRAKSAFLANTSHEIRTPLNGLVGLARMARQPGLDPARRERYLAQIDDSAQALSGVISDILDLSKIEAGKLSLEALDFDLHTLLESIEHGYAALAEARGLDLAMDLHPGVPRRVLGDPVRLRQVLSNYLSNALKFTAMGGVRIEVSAPGASRLRFCISDSGPGIDAATQARLFTPFTQGDSSTTRRFGGTGLGLSICRELAQLMGGEVGVSSQPGLGSLFWVELPLPSSGAEDPDSGFAALSSQEQSPLAGLRVLMAEDNPVNMLIAVALLEHWGVSVAQAADGAQAVQQVLAQADAGTPFDIVLMDVQMPVQGGYAATRELRRRFDSNELPVIALTAAALTSEREEALAAGMNDFLTKPIDAQRLHDSLLQWRRSPV